MKTETFAESMAVFNDYLEAHNERPLSLDEIGDQELTGDMEPAEIEELAHDFISELQSDRAEASHLKRMGDYYEY